MATSVEELDRTVKAFYESRGDVVRECIYITHPVLENRG